MTKKDLTKAIVAAVILVPISATATTHWLNKNVGMIQTYYSTTDCYYFKLEGVAEADPVVPGSPWFAMNRTLPGAKEAYSTLLAAKLSGSMVNVTTDGTLVCGYPRVHEIYVP